MSNIQKNFNFEVKEVQGDDDFYYIKGYASTPDVDRADDIVEQKALLDSVERLGLPAFMHQHDMKSMPLGVCTGVTIQGGNTIVDLKMPKNDETTKVKQLAEMGAYQGLSIGFIAKDSEFDEKGIRTIKEVDWYEVSLVTVPCNQNAKLLQVKSYNDIINDIKTIREVEGFLIDAGCSKKEACYIISLVKKSKTGEQAIDNCEGEPNDTEQKDIQSLLEIRDVLKAKGE